jgi:hypothetical protein
MALNLTDAELKRSVDDVMDRSMEQFEIDASICAENLREEFAQLRYGKRARLSV